MTASPTPAVFIVIALGYGKHKERSESLAWNLIRKIIVVENVEKVVQNVNKAS